MKTSIKTLILTLLVSAVSAQAIAYTSATTDSIPAHKREKMRRMFQEYTRQNKTTAYLTTCGYMNEIIAKAQEKGLSSTDIMNLAYENLEYFVQEHRQCVRENSPSLFLILAGVPQSDTSYACKASDVDRAMYIRQLVYECSKSTGSTVSSNQGTQQVNTKQTNASLFQVNN